jgi:hypothetical protein
MQAAVNLQARCRSKVRESIPQVKKYVNEIRRQIVPKIKSIHWDMVYNRFILTNLKAQLRQKIVISKGIIQIIL